MSVKLRTLNNYPEWKTKESIVGVAKYLETRTNDDPLFPPNIKSKQQRNRYIKKFGNGDFQVQKIGNTYEIYYQPPLESNKD